MNESKKIQFAATPQAFKTDRQAGTMSDLELMCSGREAKGHGLYIDKKTVETFVAAVKARGGRLKAYATHKHDGPTTGSWSWTEQDGELAIIGYFEGIADVNGTAVAKSFAFFDAYKESNQDDYRLLMEIAERTPDLIALSVEIWGYAVFVAQDGTEFSERPKDVELLNEGLPTLRITEAFAAAFVSDGAATDGLFAAFKRWFGGKQRGQDQTALHPLAHKGDTDSTMSIIKEIKTRFSAEPAKVQKALGILAKADNPESVTLSSIESQLAAQELTDLNTQMGTLTKERDDLKTQLGTITKERDDLKTKIEGLGKSGYSGQINLGAASEGATGTEVNPWKQGAENLTEQACILKADPARAKALKAAAGIK
jgi:hypothetical protein